MEVKINNTEDIISLDKTMMDIAKKIKKKDIDVSDGNIINWGLIFSVVEVKDE